MTDVGLRELAELENFESLGIRHTQITNAGLQELIGPQKAFCSLDIAETQVNGTTRD